MNLIKKLTKQLIAWRGELLVIFLFIALSNQFLATRKDLIQADGRGYYEYLPATFIYKDLKLQYLDTLKSEYYDASLMSNDFYPRLSAGQRFDKYFIGTAVLQVPFFAIGHIWAHFWRHSTDGFSFPYQQSIYFAALFYAFFGLVFIRLLLLSYNVNRLTIVAIQIGVVFCGSLLNYMHWDAAYSHVYSFFLIAGFIYFARNYILNHTKYSLFWTIILLAIICLVRPVNFIIVLFIPLLSDNYQQLFSAFKDAFKNRLKLTICAILLSLIILQIQCVVWYFQTGYWFYYAYGKETFIWSDPMVNDFLFSYRKGFFLWAPWFFIVILISIFAHIYRRNWYRLISFLAAFSVLIFVLSSWWFWSYGGSIGSRPMVEFYPIIIAFAAPLFAQKSNFLKWLIIVPIPFLATVMVTQVYQYQRQIITPDQMNKVDYWKVFLHREPMYELYLYKKDIKKGILLAEIPWEKDVQIQADRWFISDTLAIDNEILQKAKVGQVTFLSPQKSNEESLEIRLLSSNDSLLYNHYNCMLHAVDEKRGKQFLDYTFELPITLPSKFKAVFIINSKSSAVTVNSMKIRFFTD